MTLIMDDPEYWSQELIKRATNRMIYLEEQADAIYRGARTRSLKNRNHANTTLMGAGALVLRHRRL